MAVVWQQEQALRCADCGLADWQFEEQEWRAGKRYCKGCQRLDGYTRNMTPEAGVKVGLKRGD